MSERLTSIGMERFLKDFSENAQIKILEEGSSEKNEIIQIAKHRGINLKDNADLSGLKCIYAFADKKNKNGVILPEYELLKALPSMIGKPINIAHNRRYVVGHILDYRYIQEGKKVIMYGAVYRSNFANEWKQVKKDFKDKKLNVSFEIWSPEDKRKYNDDGSYELLHQEIAGCAILFRDDSPAFPGAHVLSLAKNIVNSERNLVYASKYREEEIIVAEDYFMKDVKENFKRVQEERKVKEQKKVEPKVEDKKPIEEPKKEEPKPEEKKPEPQSGKIKCSNCGEQLDYNGIDVRVKCTKCFAILNKEGTMQYPPQIMNFKMLCPACKVGNWLILSKTDKEAKLRCENCAKEYRIEFTQEDPQAKKILSKLNIVRKDIVYCYQCGHSIDFVGLSTIKNRTIKCPKCGIEFEYDIESKQQKKVSKIEEIKIDKIEKSAKIEKGGKEMDYKLETSKYHRYIDVEKFEDFEKSLSEDYDKDMEKAARLTTEQRNALPDSDFAVVVRVKDKRTGKMRKIRMYPINDKAHVRNALARLGQPKPQATLKRLGVSIESVRAKILARARKLGMTELLERYKKATKKVEPKKAEKFNCSCVKCGYKVTTDEHCVNLKCPKCGGQMRRADRPGDGKPEDKKKAEAKLAEAQKKDVALYALEDKLAKYVKGIRKLASKIRSVNKEVTIAKTEKNTKIKFYMENAKTILKRREELGETELTDEQIMNDKDFEIAKLKKEVDKKNTSKIATASEKAGNKPKDKEFYVEKRKKIDAIAFKETETRI